MALVAAPGVVVLAPGVGEQQGERAMARRRVEPGAWRCIDPGASAGSRSAPVGTAARLAR